MENLKNKILGTLAGLAVAGSSYAATVSVSSNITTSTTWTANNTYKLTKQIYVKPGATLTIEAGTIVKSDAGVGGSLAVCRGAKIYVNGTKDAPVIMTSSNDTMTSWHEGCNEWGNLTIMGDALIGCSYTAGNTKTPTGLNVRDMEGLTAVSGSETDIQYGGDNDDDDSGALHYLSLRYGGKVIGLGNELNGLSMGGIGRETEVDHVEIMNNVDDGIETWGGTVNYKYLTIWNVGDDSMDIDQGWRGKAQFVLIVQGYSTNASQGSGVGDNCFETDGAEDSDAQPVTTGVIYNATVVGQPIDGDHGTAWRDGCRLQYRNCIFMDLGEDLIHLDNVDGDGAHGYNYNGTPTFESLWTTAYSVRPMVNAISPVPAAGVFNNPEVLYQAQTSGYLAEMSDCVFYRNDFASVYTKSNELGVTSGGGSAGTNVVAYSDGESDANMPIQSLERGAMVTRGGKSMLPVTHINPCAANDAVTSVAAAPADGFFTPAKFRGAFSSTNNWMAGWTAADAYGMIDASMNAANPSASNSLTEIKTQTSFPTEDGVVYTVEKSSDMKTWVPVQTVVGDGGTMSVEDLDTFENGKFYRVIRQ